MPLSAAAQAKRLAYQKRWYQENKARRLASTNAWREQNRNRVNELSRRRRQGNAEYLAKRRERRSKDVVGPAYERLYRTAAGAPHASRDELRALLERQAGACGLTGGRIPPEVKPHLDHIVPRAKGGGHTIDNLRWVHPMANRAKGAHTDAEFLAWWNSR